MENSGPHSQPAAIQEEDPMPEVTYSSGGCCCFVNPWSTGRHSSSSSSSPSQWERIRSGDEPRSASSPVVSGWWSAGVRAFFKAREWSELVAGPKWKTFIRRLKTQRKTGAARFGGNGHQRKGSFGYDPLSYALNFDGNGSPDRDGGYPDFSARFAATPTFTNSSVDFGGRDAPPVLAA